MSKSFSDLNKEERKLFTDTLAYFYPNLKFIIGDLKNKEGVNYTFLDVNGSNKEIERFFEDEKTKKLFFPENFEYYDSQLPDKKTIISENNNAKKIGINLITPLITIMTELDQKKIQSNVIEEEQEKKKSSPIVNFVDTLSTLLLPNYISNLLFNPLLSSNDPKKQANTMIMGYLTKGHNLDFVLNKGKLDESESTKNIFEIKKDETGLNKYYITCEKSDESMKVVTSLVYDELIDPEAITINDQEIFIDIEKVDISKGKDDIKTYNKTNLTGLKESQIIENQLEQLETINGKIKQREADKKLVESKKSTLQVQDGIFSKQQKSDDRVYLSLVKMADFLVEQLNQSLESQKQKQELQKQKLVTAPILQTQQKEQEEEQQKEQEKDMKKTKNLISDIRNGLMGYYADKISRCGNGQEKIIDDDYKKKIKFLTDISSDETATKDEREKASGVVLNGYRDMPADFVDRLSKSTTEIKKNMEQNNENDKKTNEDYINNNFALGVYYYYKYDKNKKNKENKSELKNYKEDGAKCVEFLSEIVANKNATQHYRQIAASFLLKIYKDSTESEGKNKIAIDDVKIRAAFNYLLDQHLLGQETKFIHKDVCDIDFLLEISEENDAFKEKLQKEIKQQLNETEKQLNKIFPESEENIYEMPQDDLEKLTEIEGLIADIKKEQKKSEEELGENEEEREEEEESDENSIEKNSIKIFPPENKNDRGALENILAVLLVEEKDISIKNHTEVKYPYYSISSPNPLALQNLKQKLIKFSDAKKNDPKYNELIENNSDKILERWEKTLSKLKEVDSSKKKNEYDNNINILLPVIKRKASEKITKEMFEDDKKMLAQFKVALAKYSYYKYIKTTGAKEDKKERKEYKEECDRSLKEAIDLGNEEAMKFKIKILGKEIENSKSACSESIKKEYLGVINKLLTQTVDENTFEEYHKKLIENIKYFYQEDGESNATKEVEKELRVEEIVEEEMEEGEETGWEKEQEQEEVNLDKKAVLKQTVEPYVKKLKNLINQGVIKGSEINVGDNQTITLSATQVEGKENNLSATIDSLLLLGVIKNKDCIKYKNENTAATISFKDIKIKELLTIEGDLKEDNSGHSLSGYKEIVGKVEEDKKLLKNFISIVTGIDVKDIKVDINVLNNHNENITIDINKSIMHEKKINPSDIFKRLESVYIVHEIGGFNFTNKISFKEDEKGKSGLTYSLVSGAINDEICLKKIPDENKKGTVYAKVLSDVIKKIINKCNENEYALFAKGTKTIDNKESIDDFIEIKNVVDIKKKSGISEAHVIKQLKTLGIIKDKGITTEDKLNSFQININDINLDRLFKCSQMSHQAITNELINHFLKVIFNYFKSLYTYFVPNPDSKTITVGTPVGGNENVNEEQKKEDLKIKQQIGGGTEKSTLEKLITEKENFTTKEIDSAIGDIEINTKKASNVAETDYDVKASKVDDRIEKVGIKISEKKTNEQEESEKTESETETEKEVDDNNNWFSNE